MPGSTLMTNEQLDELLAKHAEHYKRPDIQKLLSAAGQTTLAWLLENKGVINVKGEPIERPWFNEKGFAAELPNRMAERARHRTLDEQAYEQAVPKFLDIAGRTPALKYRDEDDLASLVMLRSGETQGWFDILNRYSWIEKSMNLEHFAETGDGNPNTPPSHSKGKLEALARFGFVLVEKRGRSFEITVGPSAKILYEEVLFPVTEEFRSRIPSWKEQTKMNALPNIRRAVTAATAGVMIALAIAAVSPLSTARFTQKAIGDGQGVVVVAANTAGDGQGVVV
jgi:hypothetical protein